MLGQSTGLRYFRSGESDQKVFTVQLYIKRCGIEDRYVKFKVKGEVGQAGVHYFDRGNFEDKDEEDSSMRILTFGEARQVALHCTAWRVS